MGSQHIPASTSDTLERCAGGWRKSVTEKCKKKGHISCLHPSFLRLGLQILGFARFCSVEWARGAVEEPGERVSGGVCTF